MNARTNPKIILCVGCGYCFEGYKAFELHATGGQPTLRRCRTVKEMHRLKMRQKPGNHNWYIPRSRA